MKSSRLRSRALVALIPVLAVVAPTGYLLWARAHGLLGFPLDDAWIHQTYARNLAETGQLAYLPGQPSAGSTSPAWSYLLSVGYLLGLDFHLWAYLLGGLALAASAWLIYRLSRRLFPSRPLAALLAGLFCAGEWHLVWAAASGMETMLFTALSLALLEYYLGQIAARRSPDRPGALRTEQNIVSAVGIGLVGGLLTLTRPEGLGLTGLVIAGLVLLPWPPDRGEIRSRLLAAAASVLALGVLLTPYLLFNWNTAGMPFPNTFYAKQAEYQPGGSLLSRLWRVLSPTLVGAQVLLVPGFCAAGYQFVRRRRWPALLPLVWWLVFLVAYALRLPVDYQHGRYTMPTIPLLILYGVAGTADLVRPGSPRLAVRLLSRAVPVAVAVLALLFLGRGAVAYRDDVGFIEGELVATARWLNENTAPGDLIAVHDIGAVGYLTDRPLLDLAGLITPDVIPFIADADRLAAWMIERGAAYAVLFPDFSPAYARLAADRRLTVVHCTGYAWTRAAGHQNLCVYRLSLRETPPESCTKLDYVVYWRITADQAVRLHPGRPESGRRVEVRGMHRITVMIVDDHPVFRQGLRRVLEGEDDLEVVAEVADGIEAFQLAKQLLPDVMLLDINLPGMNGLQVARSLKDALLNINIIMLTAYHDEQQVFHSIQAGASAYFPKDVSPRRLIEAIRLVHQGSYVIEDRVLEKPQVGAWLLEQFEQVDKEAGGDLGALFLPLSPREMEILQYIAQGKSNKEIAYSLGISRQTVKNHMTSILRKLAVNDRTQAAIYALRRGWIRLQDIG